MEDRFRKAVFIVVYKKEKDKIIYLILKRKLHWSGWEFPKGGIEKNENIINTIKREMKEETGLDIKSKPRKFNFNGSYRYKRKYPDRPGYLGQSYSLYAVEVYGKKVKIDNREHSYYMWLDFKRAIKKLTHKNQKRSLEIVNSWLEKQNEKQNNKV